MRNKSRGIFPDCPPKPLSQRGGGTSSEWMDKAALIPITGGPEIQFAFRAAAELGAIRRGRGRRPRQHRTANCLCLAWQPSPVPGAG